MTSWRRRQESRRWLYWGDVHHLRQIEAELRRSSIDSKSGTGITPGSRRAGSPGRGRPAAAQGHQRGWLKKERRSNGETWMLFFRTTRESDGKRVEQKVAVGTVRDLPTKASAWAEVERQHIQINRPDFRK